MKRVTKINNFEKVAIVALGLLIAVFSIVSPYQYMLVDTDSEIVQNSDIDKQSNDDTEKGSKVDLVVKALDAVPNALQISGLNGVAGYLSRFVFEASPKQVVSPKGIPSSSSKLFKTLFRYIISPNAP